MRPALNHPLLRHAALVIGCLSLPAQVPLDMPTSLLRVEPGSPATIYLGLTGGLLRSTDNGATWQQLPVHPLGRVQPPVHGFEIGPNASTLSLATSGRHGFFWRSLDRGTTWQQGNGLPEGAAEDISRLDVVETGGGMRLYLQIRSHGSAATFRYRLYRSSNAGETWTLLGEPGNWAAIAPSDPAYMLYHRGVDVYRSQNEGASWSRIGQVRGLQPGDLDGVGGLAISPLDRNIVLATMTGPHSVLNGIFRSTNGGASFTRVSTGNNIGVRFSRERPQQAFAGDCCGNMSVYLSSNGGQSWQARRLVPNASDPRFGSLEFAVRPDSNDLLAPSNRGVWRSTNAGGAWQQVQGTYRPTLVLDPDDVEGRLPPFSRSTLSPDVELRALEDAGFRFTDTTVESLAEWVRVNLTATSTAVILSSETLEPGGYQTTLRFRNPAAVNPLLEVPVSLEVVDPDTVAPHLLVRERIPGLGFLNAIVTTPDGDLYAAESRRVYRYGFRGQPEVVAGTGESGSGGDGGPAVNAQFQRITGLAYGGGNLYIADGSGNTIRKVDAAGMITHVAGASTGNFVRSGASARTSRLFSIEGLAVAPSGLLHFSDSTSIWRINSSGTLELAAGRDGSTGAGESLEGVRGPVFDAQGNLYFVERTRHRVRRMDAQRRLTTVAGTGAPGFTGDGGPAVEALLDTPEGIAVDEAGNLYIADGAGTRIRRVQADGTIETVAGMGVSGRPAGCTYALLAPFFRIAQMAWHRDGHLLLNESTGSTLYALRAAPTSGRVPGAPGEGFVNAASFTADIAPGSLFSVFGANLAEAETAWLTVPWPRTVRGTAACVDDEPAPLYYLSPGQINGQVPFEARPGRRVVRVFGPGGASGQSFIEVRAAGPGVFQYGASRAVAVNADGSINGPDRPAAPGSYIEVYLTGLGALDQAVRTGEAAPADPLARPLAPFTVTIGGWQANVLYLGLTPGYVGLAQANIEVPGLAPGDYELVITIGGVASKPVLLRVG